ncbi:MAG: hypothetical protein ABI268_00540 [Rhodanobacter sp.]
MQEVCSKRVKPDRHRLSPYKPLIGRTGKIQTAVSEPDPVFDPVFAGIDQWLTPYRTKRRLYSIMRLGREALVRRWSNAKLNELIEQIRKPSPALLDQMIASA